MAQQSPPITFQQLLDMTSLGVAATNCSFQTLTMESDKYICVRELPENGQGGNVVIIDMENPSSAVRHSITADSAIMNPSKYILALRSQQTLQIFNIAEKAKLKSYNMPDPVVFWRWLTPTLMGIVTTKSVYHWEIEDLKAEPVKMYDRLKELEGHQIISYRADASLKWFCLVGLAQESGRVVGWTQLYSADKNVAQPLRGQAATFAKYTPPGSNQELTLFCFAHRTAGESKLIIREVNRTNAGPESSANKFGAVAGITFPDEAAGDFPVSMEVSPKYDVIYLVTRMGLLHIFDIATGKLIYMNRIAQEKDTIFVTTPHKGGMLGVNKAGKVLHINLNEQTIIPYIMSKPDVELAIKLAARANLPGADDLFLKQFQAFMTQGRYADAARVAAEAPASLLRTPQTIQLFQTQPVRANEPPPILQYFGALMERGRLNKIESATLARLVTSQARKDLIEKWLAEDKLDWTDEVGDIVRPLDRALAIKIYIKADAKEKAAFGLAEEGLFEQLVQWAQAVKYNPDWLKLLGALSQANPDGAVALAKLLLSQNVQVSREAVIDIFVKRNMIPQVTSLVVDVNQNKPEDGPLQTLILELNLLHAPPAAEFIFANQLFSHFNKKRIAELCEKANLQFRALQLYTELSDRKRVLRAAHSMPPEAVAEWFANLGKQDSLECLKEMLVANTRQNLPVVILVAQRFHEALGAAALVQLFESVKSYEGIHGFLNPLLPLINDPEVIFKFIEAAARTGQIADVERVCRESKFYNPERVRDFLKDIKLSSPLPLIIVCDTYGFIPDMVKYLAKNSMRQAIEGYLTQMSPASTPAVVGTLLDVDDGSGADDFIKNLLNLVGSRCPIEPLVTEVEARNKLRLIQGWLEARAAEGNQETALHNALLKIYVDTRNDVERRLRENKFYDHKVVGGYCEGRDAQLAFLAYETAAGTCDDELIAISNKGALMKQLAKYLIARRDAQLWAKVLSEENVEHRRSLVDQVQSVLPESRVPDEIVATVSAFRTPGLNLEQELIGLVEKIIFQGANEEFKTYPQLQNLLVLTAIRAWKPDFQTRVMEYIKRLDKYDVDAVAENAIAAGLFEEAFAALQKAEKNVAAIDVLLSNLRSIDRASDFADSVNKPEVFTRLGKAQLDNGDIPDAIASFIKAGDAQFYHEVVAAVHSNASERLYLELIKFLQMARRQLNESKIDSELIYAYAKTSSIVEIEQFLAGSHRANVQDIGERCFDEGNYQAARVLFNDIKNYARLATTLVKLDDLSAAVEMARKAQSVTTWKAISKACVESHNFKLARTCGLHIIIHGDELLELIRFYENRGHFDELMALVENGLELERAHPGMFTELGVLYAQHRPEKLLEHLRANITKMNPARVQVACEQNLLWKESAFILQAEKDFDKCAITMMEHPGAFDAALFPGVLAKAGSTEIVARGIRFYIEEHPAALNDLLTSISGRLDHRRVIEIARETNTLPLIKGYLQKAQEGNVQVVNEALNDILIDEEDYNALRLSIEHYNAFEPVTLAKRLEKHALLEFRRIAASLYKAKSKWGHAIELFKQDKQYQDAMVAAAESKDRKIAEDLLQYFVAQNNPEAFSAALYHCYDILRPDAVLELAWRNKLSDYAMPYLIQSFSDLHTKVDQLAEAMLKRREETHAIQAHMETAASSMPYATVVPGQVPINPHMTGVPAPHNPLMTMPAAPMFHPPSAFATAPAPAYHMMSNPQPGSFPAGNFPPAF
jgi:clathrin heavy chain